jgi:hypothetical protein
MIYGPKDDGTYVRRISDGHRRVLAISIPRTAALGKSRPSEWKEGRLSGRPFYLFFALASRRSLMTRSVTGSSWLARLAALLLHLLAGRVTGRAGMPGDRPLVLHTLARCVLLCRILSKTNSGRSDHQAGRGRNR